VTTRARALLVLVATVVVATTVLGTAADATPVAPFHAYVVVVDGATLDDLLAVPTVSSIARAGGAGWMSPAADVPSTLEELASASRRDVSTLRVPAGRSDVLSATMERLRSALSSRPDRSDLVIVVGGSPSPAMLAAKDDLGPIVVAFGPADELFPSEGGPRTVTSDSTRRVGVVAAADVASTVGGFLGRSITDAGGHTIRFVDERPPFDLHERYLAMRRMAVPVQTAAGLYVTVAGLFGLAVLWLGRRAPSVLGVIASGTAISVGPLAAALLAAGHLPTLSYATVVAFAIVVTAILVGLVLLGATRGLLHPVMPLGVVLLAFLLVEDLLGWLGALTPFLGGSELDGGRFFGLPNVFIGLLLGASLYVASRLPAVAGFVILLAAGLFAGLPFAGANLGGAVTMFAAAGLWLPMRARGRLGWRELAFAAGVVVAGTALVLVAHRLSPLPTHVTRFEETEGAGGVWSTFVDRLGVGWRLIVRNPFALVPVVGVLAMVAVMLRPPAIVAATLHRHPGWRDALLVLSLTNVVAYLVNDSGPAACGVGFGMALGGLLYVSVAERTWKMAAA
jgi:hypothetical protein